MLLSPSPRSCWLPLLPTRDYPATPGSATTTTGYHQPLPIYPCGIEALRDGFIPLTYTATVNPASKKRKRDALFNSFSLKEEVAIGNGRTADIPGLLDLHVS